MDEPRPDKSLRPALEALAAADPDIAAAFEVCGLPPRRHRPQGYAGLIHIIAAQQVSAAAARAIIGRLDAAADPLTPETFLALSEEALKGVGLSRSKIGYARGLAENVLSGALDLDGLDKMDDEAAVRHLCAAKGIGRWSAEIYLLFALKRPDVWPAGDLAIRHAVKRLKRFRKFPDEERVRKTANKWRPYRSAAARFLWHYYHHPGLVD